jgi:hypothetical protein
VKSDSPPSEPVYNAIAEPNGGAPDILLHHTPTKIFFNIGMPNLRSMISKPEIAQRLLEELKRNDNTDVAIVMTCYVCANETPLTRSIRYSAPQKRSTVAEFDIVPDLEAAKMRDAQSISFSIRHDGKELDFINVPVRLQQPTAPAGVILAQEQPLNRPATPPGSVCAPNFNDLSNMNNMDEKYDLDVTLSRDENGLKVGFEPHDRMLALRLSGYQLKQNGDVKFFRTNVGSPEEAIDIAGTIYVDLKRLVTPDPTLKEALPDYSHLEQALTFDERKRKEALEGLYKLGRYMYYKIFDTGDLRSIMNIIERYAAERNENHKNLRVQIYTPSIYLPWQLLHAIQADGTDPDPSEFWGHEYILGVNPGGHISSANPEGQSRCGRMPGAMNQPEKSEVLYAHYFQEPFADKDPDNVSAMGKRFAPVLHNAFVDDDIVIVRAKRAFRMQLFDDRRYMKILWTFTHGHSGTECATLKVAEKNPDKKDASDEKKLPVCLREINGQRIIFSEAEADFVSNKELDMVLITKEDGPFFVKKPFVFLNGCETGTQGSGGTTQLSFAGIFINRGARAVIATEAVVWDWFGYGFGQEFLKRLSPGTSDAGEALLATRIHFWNKSNNPLGLLYSYYGNPFVRFSAAQHP